MEQMYISIAKSCEQNVQQAYLQNDYEYPEKVDLTSLFSKHNLQQMNLPHPLDDVDWRIGNYMDNSWHVVMEEAGLVAFPDVED